jgi:hypothetical protein
LLDISNIPARLTVVDEGTHGTSQAPAFVAGLVCAFAKTGKPVILAWESSRDVQAAVNDFIESAGTPKDRELLVASALHGSDGRSSLAILSMLDVIRILRSKGSRVAVSLVDTAESDLLLPLYGENKYDMYSQARRQALMATNVESRLDQYPDHQILFFTSHASRTVGALGNGYESATLLVSRKFPVYVIGLAHSGGTAWRCQGKTPREALCKIYDIEANSQYPDADRVVDLGVVSASPPASPHPTPIYTSTAAPEK